MKQTPHLNEFLDTASTVVVESIHSIAAVGQTKHNLK